MKSHQSLIGTIRLFAIALAATFVFVGCSGQDEITGPESARVDLFADPLDGVMNSTDGSTPHGTADRIDRLAEVLDLTEAQKEALLVAYSEFRAGMEDLRAKFGAGEMNREEAWEAMRALRDAFEAELQTILTEEQWDLLQEMRAAHHSGRPHHGRSLEDRWNYWLEEIGASEEQVADVMEALQTSRDGFLTLREQLHAGEITWEEARETARVLRDAFDAALQEILTPEQYEALLELRPDAQHRHNDGDGGHHGEDDHDGGDGDGDHDGDGGHHGGHDH